MKWYEMLHAQLSAPLLVGDLECGTVPPLPSLIFLGEGLPFWKTFLWSGQTDAEGLQCGIAHPMV